MATLGSVIAQVQQLQLSVNYLIESLRIVVYKVNVLDPGKDPVDARHLWQLIKG